MAIYDMPSSFTRKRRFLKITVVMMPAMKPIKIEPATTSKNLNINNPISELSMSKLGLLLSVTISLIVSKRVIAIVSLYSDSPSIIENSFGYLALSTTFSVTMGSTLQKAADMRRICQLASKM